MLNLRYISIPSVHCLFCNAQLCIHCHLLQHKMPHKENNNVISIVELHPTFAAELRGVDFSKPISPRFFAEIHDAITKVSWNTSPCPAFLAQHAGQYGVVKFPDTGLDDAGHVAFAAKFGELDDVTPYTKQGKKHRLAFEQLFDVSNLLDDGSVAPLDSHRAAMNKVGACKSIRR